MEKKVLASWPKQIFSKYELQQLPKLYASVFMVLTRTFSIGKVQYVWIEVIQRCTQWNRWGITAWIPCYVRSCFWRCRDEWNQFSKRIEFWKLWSRPLALVVPKWWRQPLRSYFWKLSTCRLGKLAKQNQFYRYCLISVTMFDSHCRRWVFYGLSEGHVLCEQFL